MNQQTIDKSIKVMALVQVLISEIDSLSEEKAVFSNSIKYTGNAFNRQLEALFKNYYQNIKVNDTECSTGELLHYKHVASIEKLIKEYLCGNLTVILDGETA
jgi:hypothetical protein